MPSASRKSTIQESEHDGFEEGKSDIVADADGTISAIATANKISTGKQDAPKKPIQLDDRFSRMMDDAKIIMATARKYNASEDQIKADLKEHFKKDFQRGLIIRGDGVPETPHDHEKSEFLRSKFDDKLNEVKLLSTTGDLDPEQVAYLSYIRQCDAETLEVNGKFLVAMADGIKFFHELIVHKAEDWSFLQLVITLMNEVEGEMLEIGEDIQGYTRTESQIQEVSANLESVAGSVALPKVSSISSSAGINTGVDSEDDHVVQTVSDELQNIYEMKKPERELHSLEISANSRLGKLARMWLAVTECEMKKPERELHRLANSRLGKLARMWLAVTTELEDNQHVPTRYR